MVFHGDDGLDELTTTTASQVWLYADGTVSTSVLDPAELGIPRGEPAQLVGGNADVNAAVATELLDGTPGPVRDIVLLNAAAALLAYDGVDSRPLTEQFAPPLERAAEAVDSGAAKAKLADWTTADDSRPRRV